MTTNEAIDQLRQCGVEELPMHKRSGTDESHWMTSNGTIIDDDDDAALIAFSIGVQWLRDSGFKPTIYVSGVGLTTSFIHGTGDLANVVAAVEAASGAHRP